jgi:hypothetical protein
MLAIACCHAEKQSVTGSDWHLASTSPEHPALAYQTVRLGRTSW